MSTLSARGAVLVEKPARIDMKLFFEAMEHPYHSTERPDGNIALNVAENVPISQLVRAKLEALARAHPIPDWTMQYTSPLGHPEVREAVAGFMRQYFRSSAITAETLCFSAGASASLEVAGFVLADAGDVVVIPAPAYPMYTNDLGLKNEVERYDLQTHHAIKGRSTLALVTIDDLEEAYAKISRQGKRFRMLIITTPDNPSGSQYSRQQLTEIARWCTKKEVHLLVSEIYALSLMDTEHPELEDDYPFQMKPFSFAEIMAAEQSDYLHFGYALSKDFGASGHRFGILHSLNVDFLTALGNVNIPHMASNLSQWLFGLLFQDGEFLKQYAIKNREILTESYLITVKTLRKLGLPYIPARGSLFVWADFSRFLSENTAVAELEFWEKIYRNTGLLVTPGSGFQHTQHGLYRIVFTAVDAATLTVAMQRLESWLSEQHVD